MKNPIYAAFSTQKGGAGKTTLTVLAAVIHTAVFVLAFIVFAFFD